MILIRSKRNHVLSLLKTLSWLSIVLRIKTESSSWPIRSGPLVLFSDFNSCYSLPYSLLLPHLSLYFPANTPTCGMCLLWSFHLLFPPPGSLFRYRHAFLCHFLQLFTKYIFIRPLATLCKLTTPSKLPLPLSVLLVFIVLTYFTLLNALPLECKLHVLFTAVSSAPRTIPVTK